MIAYIYVYIVYIHYYTLMFFCQCHKVRFFIQTNPVLILSYHLIYTNPLCTICNKTVISQINPLVNVISNNLVHYTKLISVLTFPL